MMELESMATLRSISRGPIEWKVELMLMVISSGRFANTGKRKAIRQRKLS